MREIKKVTNDWLEQTSDEFSRAGVHINDRAERAFTKWQYENSDDFTLIEGENSEAIAKQISYQRDKILSYFLTQRTKDWGYIEGPFTGVFYYGGRFWEVAIPMVMGSPRINPFHLLKMADPPRQQFLSDKEAQRDYIDVFCDSYDYAYSIEELDHRGVGGFSKQLFVSGDKHLRAVKALLHQDKVSPKAVEDARMAVEMFLKAYVVLKDSLSEIQILHRYSHDLDILSARVATLGVNDITGLRPRILRFPGVASRYNIQDRTFGELWSAYLLALRTAVAVLRPISGRDMRGAVKLN